MDNYYTVTDQYTTASDGDSCINPAFQISLEDRFIVNYAFHGTEQSKSWFWQKNTHAIQGSDAH